jgi:hypothetical protein
MPKHDRQTTLLDHGGDASAETPSEQRRDDTGVITHDDETSPATSEFGALTVKDVPWSSTEELHAELGAPVGAYWPWISGERVRDPIIRPAPVFPSDEVSRHNADHYLTGICPSGF